MTAEPRVEWFPHGHPFAKADLNVMPDNGNRYEVIDGALIVTPAPSWQHQAAVTGIWYGLHTACLPDMRVSLPR